MVCLFKHYHAAVVLVALIFIILHTVVSFSGSPPSSVKPQNKNELFPYQRDGVERLIAKKRLLLADDMGLGKTIQCIEAINRIGKKDSIILVVCPKSVLGVWQSELETWLQPKLASLWEIHVASTKDKPVLRPGSITLINYDICHKLREIVQKPHYDVLICDEAHYLKSPDAKRTKTILGDVDSAGIQSDHLWLLTGTPVLNRPVELYSLVHAIAPKEFPLFEDYANQYCDPKTKTLHARNGREIFIQDYSGSSNLQELSKRLEPIMLRRYKMDVLSQLPPKFRSCTCLTTDVDIAQQEKELLKAALKDNLNTTTAAALTGHELDLDDFSSEAGKLMTYVGSDNAMLAKISAVRQETAFLKLKPSIELLEEYLPLEKVVVFAHHRAVIDELMKHFGDRAVGIKGGMKREKRDEAVREFQDDPNVRLFVGSIRAAGVGLTLTAASHVVFLELDWSPGVMTQAEDRCHRVGQANSVRIQYFVFKDTIDEWLSKSLLFKQSNINQILPEKLAGAETGYVFNFGKHEGIRLEDTPRPYVQYLLKKDVWRTRPDLWRALAKMGLVLEEPPAPVQDRQKSTSQLPHKQNINNGAPPVSAQKTRQSPAGPPQNTSSSSSITATTTTSSKDLKNVDYVFDFGKHTGKAWEDVPETYHDWLLREKVWQSKGRQNLLDALKIAGFEPS